MLTSKPTVNLICDSVNEAGDRLTTFEVKYWRPILPEMNTHRVFSRNAASSRAQPFDARCKEIIQGNICVPEHWDAEKPGMVGREEFSDDIKKTINDRIQILARNVTSELMALNLWVKNATGDEIHKQYLNRYLEPFCQVTQLISSTEWDNFLKLRTASDAQPEIKDVAILIMDHLMNHKPVERTLHLPYITNKEFAKFGEETAKKVSVARCARVSYKAYAGEGDFERDMRLFERLKRYGHWSPFEHVALADPENFWPKDHRNYKGWCQYRARFDY